MPHIIVKMYPGRSEETKGRLAEAIAKDVASIAECSEEAVSVAIEEIAQNEWDARVYRPDILGREDALYRKPGPTS